MYIFKVVHGYAPKPPYFREFSPTLTRGHSAKLIRLPFKSDLRKSFFLCRILPTWNSLPDSLVSVRSISLQIFPAFYKAFCSLVMRRASKAHSRCARDLRIIIIIIIIIIFHMSEGSYLLSFLYARIEAGFLNESIRRVASGFIFY